MLTVGDRLAIRELLALYGHVIDELANGKAGSVTYRDVVTKTADGWRIAERVAVLRRADRIPEIS